MPLNHILINTRHRPWALPENSWKYYQEWRNVLFLHWEVDLSELQKFVPNELEIELFNAKAWVSIVGFKMQNIRPRYLPAFSPISDFVELNIRTYVKHNNKSGVYFLNIEAGSQISALLAKSLSGLPYQFARIQFSDGSFELNNRKEDNNVSIKFNNLAMVDSKSALETWLTEKYALFHVDKGKAYIFDIHHLEWPIQNIAILKSHFYYPKFENLLNGTPHLSHFSKGVEVIAWEKKAV